MNFELGDIRIYRPWRDGVPWELLALADADEARVAGYADPDWVRVAKLGDETIAVYVLGVVSPTEFTLHNLAVMPACRRRGLGRWMLGHAIGIAETKGGRVITAPAPARTSLLARAGFEPFGNGLRLILQPE